MKNLTHVKIRALVIRVMIILCAGILLMFVWQGDSALAVSQSTTLYASKDKYVDATGGHDNWDISGRTYLYVGYQVSPYYLEQSALSFNLSGIPGPVTSAVLRLYPWNRTEDPAINVYGSNNDGWSETDATIPSKDVTILTNQATTAGGESNYADYPNNFDVTSFIEAQRTGDGVATLVLSPVDTSSMNEFSFISSEDSRTVYRPQLIITYTAPSASLSSAALTESNINGATVNITLDIMTFSDASLNKANFTINGAPFTVSGVSYTDSTHCSLTLAYTGTDFDSSKSFSVTIAGSELSTGGNTTTVNTLTVAAANDAESLSLSGSAAEGAEDGAVITAQISGGQFAGTLTPANLTVSNLPDGISIGAVARVDDTHVNITLSGNSTTDYDTDITNATVSCTSAEYVDSAGGGSLSGTGFAFTAVSDAEILSLSGCATEGAEDGAVITVQILGGQFAGTLAPANWTVSNLPGGVAIGSVARVDDTHVNITLSANSTTDYDTDITNVTVSCTSAEYVDSTGGGSLSANSGITLTAVNDAESLSLSDDGSITEGAEDGELITAQISGGQFAGAITSANWSVSNLPSGVTMGAVARVDDTHVNITLSGNSTTDYDRDITNVTVSCTSAEYMDSTGGGSLSADSGVTLTAAEKVQLSASPALTESNIDGGTADITLVGMTFADTALNKACFTISGAPFTVSDVSYIDDVHCTLTLAYGGGDFDTDEFFSITVEGSELSLDRDFITNTLGVTAVNDAESLSLSDDGGITEGAENGEVIIAEISGGTFCPVTPTNWTLTGLPNGVSKGAVTRVDAHHVAITLSGNATDDYDSDITGVSVSCAADEYSDNAGGGSLSGTGIIFTAINDAESLSLSGSGMEGAEDGAVITAAISGGTFGAVTPANWTVTGLPDGVSKGAVTRADAHHVSITLSGNATDDYDSDITDISVSCTAAEYADNAGGGGLSANTGFTLTAVNDPEVFTISDDGLITEGAENGEVITASISGGQFASSLTPANWTVAGLPDGVSKGAVTRVDAHHVAITLSGNAATDYDNDIINISVSCTSAEYVDGTGGGNLTADSGVTLTAVNDDESLSLSDDGSIAEGAEDGEIITASISGGQFASSLTSANWMVTGLPSGVTKGAVTRVDDHTVTIVLSGNTVEDYDIDITNISVSCTSAEYGDSVGGGSLTGTGVTFSANNDAELLSISDDGSIVEGHEQGEVITATITGGQFASTITPASWTLTGLPVGVTKGAVTRVNSHTVSIALSGNATEDYDTNITDVSVSCTAGEYADSTGGGSLSARGVMLTAVVEPEVILSMPAVLDESNIDGAIVNITLKGMTFADAVLDKSNFTAGAPFTVSNVSYTDAVHCTLTIAYGGTDFDSTQYLDITVAGSELSAGSAIKSNRLDVSAADDAESLSISSDGSITEGAENGEVITAVITGGTFASTITSANWTVSNLPGGVSKGVLTRIDDHTVTIALSGNARWDYDENLSVSVSCAADEYSDNAGGGSLTASGVTLKAVNDPESLTISGDGQITEGAEDGEAITVLLTGGQFAASLDPGAWTVGNLPAGVSMGSVIRVSDRTVRITLSGNAAADYDTDITDVSVTCAAGQYVSGTGALSVRSGVVLTAVVEPAPTSTVTPNPLVTPSSTQAQGDNTRTITGTLLNSNGDPMVGYIIELHSSPVTAVTDANGRYTFYNVEYTDHTLIAKTPEGEEIASFILSFSQGNGFGVTMTDNGANITYTPSTVSVAITVTVAEDQSGAAISEVSGVSGPETDSKTAWWIWMLAAVLAGSAVILVIRFIRRKK